MKLKNRKTGEIKECIVLPIDESGYPNEYQVFEKGESLSELNEEWEDYEEPHTWYINDRGYVVLNEAHFTSEGEKAVKSIGNYFETKEEAEKVVEKLKALKRLKEAGFKFRDFMYGLDEESSDLISAYGKICFEMMCYDGFSEDLDLLFGEEQ